MAADVFRTIQGLYLGKHFPDDAVLSTLEYKPRPGDLFLVSYPKSGSTWTLRIMYNILMDAVDSDDPLEPIIRFPCLEMQGAEAAIYAPRPAAFKTHLPFHKNPYSPEAKYVYIARNPYDTCVSFYYHTKHFPAYKFQNGTFDEFFELFIKGRVDYGDYFDNVFSWYEHRDDPNVLFLTYEELKANTPEIIGEYTMATDVFRNIAGLHIGKHFSDDTILSTLAYKPRPGDLFLVSYPKAGSTWTQHIMYNILMNAEDPTNPFDLLMRFPCLDLQGAEAAVYAPKPSAFKSHLPFNKIPYSPEAKYVYIARNPYDTCVSFYYHTRDIPAYRFRDGTFDEFFDLFIEGRVEFGDYFQNVISCIHWTGMGEEAKESPELFERILQKTSLTHMKMLFHHDPQRTPLSKSPMLSTVRPEIRKGVLTLVALMETPMTGEFVRKGKVGDWRNHFSPEQIQRMKDRIAEASTISDFMGLWKDVDIP
ncbi:hypothetical protein HPB52_006332 [Rhipicephalus sanguineus]|uniref:Sulfotransferase domain-containing protein n=1 Tax=Rhipicephalus sanguineus TaxID=34632 RepID=A0A9D4Q9U9_RHISA|nr:hypothetical protein HPB52_006332 [Rhipicephalus sanguineus]